MFACYDFNFTLHFHSISVPTLKGTADMTPVTSMPLCVHHTWSWSWYKSCDSTQRAQTDPKIVT